jgi:3-deoxy-7-phosphoheptulonate synthase
MRRCAIRIRTIVNSIAESMEFFESMSGQRVHAALSRVEFYTSHEGLASLALGAGADSLYRTPEEAGTTCRRICRGSACAPRKVDGAHVEYFRGIANPIGVKVGAAMSAEWLQELIQILESAESTWPSDAHPSLWQQRY